MVVVFCVFLRNEHWKTQKRQEYGFLFHMPMDVMPTARWFTIFGEPVKAGSSQFDILKRGEKTYWGQSYGYDVEVGGYRRETVKRSGW